MMKRLFLCAAVIATAGIVHATPTPESNVTEPTPVEEADLATERLVALAPAPDGSAVRFDLDMDAAGYVSISGAGEQGQQATIFEGSGRQVGIGNARISNPNGAYAMLALGADSGPVALQVTSYPELDLTEPNDDALLAWPTSIGQANSALLYPANDVDVFRILLPEDSRVKVRIEHSQSPVSIRFIDPETETVISEGAIADLSAGAHAIALSYQDAAFTSFEPVGFSVVQMPMPVAPDSADLPLLSVGRPTLVSGNQQNTSSLSLIVEQTGLFKLSASNVGDSATINIEKPDGQIRPANWVHLAPGEYTVTLDSITPSEAPAFVTASVRSASDPDEPNDFSGDANPLKIGESKDFLLEWQVPVDWFSITTNEDDAVFVSAESLSEPCGTLEAGINVPGEINSYESLPRRGNLSNYTFGPLAVAAGQTVAVYLVCTDARVDSDFRVTLYSSQSNSANNSSVYLVGLELDDQIGGALGAAASVAGVDFLEADEAQTLDARLEEIARAETTARFPLWILLPIALIVAGLIWFFVRRRKSAPDRAMTAESAP